MLCTWLNWYLLIECLKTTCEYCFLTKNLHKYHYQSKTHPSLKHCIWLSLLIIIRICRAIHFDYRSFRANKYRFSKQNPIRYGLFTGFLLVLLLLAAIADAKWMCLSDAHRIAFTKWSRSCSHSGFLAHYGTLWRETDTLHFKTPPENNWALGVQTIIITNNISTFANNKPPKQHFSCQRFASSG